MTDKTSIETGDVDALTRPAAEMLRPTTLDGIKRLAKRLARERDLRHGIALASAAAQAGYSSFHAARLALSQRKTGGLNSVRSTAEPAGGEG